MAIDATPQKVAATEIGSAAEYFTQETARSATCVVVATEPILVWDSTELVLILDKQFDEDLFLRIYASIFLFSRLDFPPPVQAYHLLAKEVWWHERQNEKKTAEAAPSLACDGQIAAQTALLSRDRDNWWMASRTANTDPLAWRGNYGLLNEWLCSYHPKAQARRITAKEQALYFPCSIVLLQSAMVCQSYSRNERGQARYAASCEWQMSTSPRLSLLTMPFPTVLLSLTSVEFLLSRKAFTAVSVYVYQVK